MRERVSERDRIIKGNPLHLKEGVVVNILADVVEVVVLAAGPDALLRVGCPAGKFFL